MTEIERVRAAYAQYKDMDIQKILLEYRDFALKGGIPNVQSPHYALAGMFEWAVAALSAQASRVAELEGALRPFLDLRHQSGAHGVISKKLDDMQPLTVTVTKAQFRAAFEALGREDGEG